MATLVSSITMHKTDRRQRVPVLDLRASHGDLTDYRNMDFQLALGEEEVFEFERFMYAWFRDVTNVEITRDVNGVSVALDLGEITGILTLPFAGKMRCSVNALSPISLDRKIQVVYS